MAAYAGLAAAGRLERTLAPQPPANSRRSTGRARVKRDDLKLKYDKLMNEPRPILPKQSPRSTTWGRSGPSNTVS